MDKVISVTNKVTIKKVVELPVPLAAGLFVHYCRNHEGCVMDVYGTCCPFNGSSCVNVTSKDWEDYLNGD